ncbi:glycogen/starch/alpha-glucan phosphorylase [Clostridium sp. SYSU_GA19001]|uniref:glycogen/starch/alpha-glucan phosphorylase n=1 Tax=Clostridium caldaquaticum TaxID=2940653 RepID=UPI0020775CA4|nr:glycogen/starch/alpha-glucan phosphorylase [Clostridium caldaquaticum]MCM8710200.1 glycogen/starch/alpha-glucan phosphorylase [Clostridium caldaquaticum]
MKLNKEKFKSDYKRKLLNTFAEEIKDASKLHKYFALGGLVRDYVTSNWVNTTKYYKERGEKQVYYFSMEFLIGRLLVSNLLNLGIRDVCFEGLKDLGIDLNELEEVENDAGLGNGGLGRLAACFLDSMASLGIPGHGCGIRYKYGLFEQKIVDGYQVEIPDNWLREGNVWEIRKENKAVEVKFGGRITSTYENGRLTFIHHDYEAVKAVPYDTPIVGYDKNTVNTLRLWSAEPIDEGFDFSTFSRGDYVKAQAYRASVESISQVLYPDDSNREGKLLRLKQQYFFVSAGLQSIIRSYKKAGFSIKDFHKHNAIHINDTHPSVAVAELMRILLDEELLSWEEAWHITTNSMAYTNHTILAEALEKWPVDMFRELLPRIYMIIEEINRRFCEELSRKYVNQGGKINSMSIIQDGLVKMAHLSIVGSHSVNGVAKLHTEILKHQELSNFYDFYPEKFNNKTNGITHRRWLLKANPKLASLINETIGINWIKAPIELNRLESYKNNKGFQDKVYDIKRQNKIQFSNMVKSKYGISLDPNSIFDVQVKRLHAYKRQMLNVLHIMHLYNQLKENPNLDIVPRTFLFGAKASPSYHLAKQIIKLINSVASKVNSDPQINGKLKVLFLENYSVSLAEKIIPCADVSEQISTASKEASGTGNMKFMMNGAITIATLDGANIEIKDAVGEDNIILFGLKASEVLSYHKYGGYSSWDIYNNDIRVNKLLNQLVDGSLAPSHSEFKNIHESLLMFNDEYFVLKDFDAYVKAQEKIDALYRQKSKWQEMSITNIAHSGIFSSDNTIREYSKGIWGTKEIDNISI